MSDYQVIGSCSLCGGPVQVPQAWWGVIPPTPSCGNCGAIQRRNHGPVIDMEPSRTITSNKLFWDAARGIVARSDETPQAAQPEGQEPDPKGRAQSQGATDQHQVSGEGVK